MLIDWFTVAAQLINFLILIWLLKRFLYQPVIEALDKREKKIATELEHAASVEREAAREKDEWQRKNDEFEVQRQLMMKRVTNEAETRRAELLDKAREEYDALHSRLLETLTREQEERQEETERLVSDEIFSVAGKLLSELADESLEARIIDKFCRKLEAKSEAIAARFTGDDGTARQAVIRTTFPLAPAQREKVTGTIEALLGSVTPLSFEISDTSGCGIELCVDGLCVSWRFEAALDTLKQSAEAYREEAAEGEVADA